MARAAIHGSRARLAISRHSVCSWVCGAQGMEQTRLDLPRKGCAQVLAVFRLHIEAKCLSGMSIVGIWLSPNAESLPVLTLFGSTNLNSRSAHLDTELSFVMLANSVTVQKKLQLELQGLNEFAEDWKGDRRRVRLVTKILVRLLSGYL
jgi:hypothetical protein